jgi:glycine/D-amino acid oxidase-like deaminating enzyme
LGRAKSFGIEAELISGEEAYKKWPMIEQKDINGALWLPNDGTAVSSDCNIALANAAKENGVRIFENTEVLKINSQNKCI